MGLQECGLNLNNSGKELKPHGTFEFPCAGYLKKFIDEQEDIIPWHYHEELEIMYVKEGRLKIQIPTKSFYLESGDCIVINSNIPHYISTDCSCELQSIVFDPMLITGSNDSVFAKKYILPLISCSSFNGYLLKSNDYNKEITYFINAFKALAQETYGFEFIVRECLSNICFLIYSQFENKLYKEDKSLHHDDIRIKKMINYIHEHFSYNLTLAEIAKAADVGERECLRCFKRLIQLSPIQYLLKYRMMKGAEYLLENPTNTISEISSLCGFDSSSNFSKLFKRFYKCTPREYRNLNLK